MSTSKQGPFEVKRRKASEAGRTLREWRDELRSHRHRPDHGKDGQGDLDLGNEPE